MTLGTPALLDGTLPLSLELPFTYAQAIRAGIARSQLGHLLRNGLVRRLLRGVYAAAQVPDSQLLRARAIRLVVPEGCIVTDESAGWLAGASMILRPNAHLAVPPLTVFGTSGHGRLRNALCDSGTRALRPEDITEVHGIRVTTPLRTALDLGRLRHRDRAIAALDQMLRLEVFDREELLERVALIKGARGIRQLRVLAPIADGRAESPGESALRLRFHDGGLPIPEPQVDIFDSSGNFLGRGDLVIEELKFLAEYDGADWHGYEREAVDAARRRPMRQEGWTIRVCRRSNVYGRDQDAIQLLTQGIREARRRIADGRGREY